MNPETFLLCGCTSGIGLETLKALRSDGHRIVAAVRNPEALAEFEMCRSSVLTRRMRTLRSSCQTLLDGLTYFPGTITLESFRALTDDDFRRDLEINARGLQRKGDIEAYVQKVERLVSIAGQTRALCITAASYCSPRFVAVGFSRGLSPGVRSTSLSPTPSPP